MINIRSSSRLFAAGSLLLRRLCTATVAEAAEATAASPAGASTTGPLIEYKRLYRRISGIAATGESVSDVLHRHIREGNRVGKINLLNIARALRKTKRYNHCLEIFAWMDKGKFNYSHRDLAFRLNITYKASGMKAAEEYFESLSTDSKDLYTYGALLNCYCEEKMSDKAVDLFEEMDKKGYASTLAFSNLMTLSMTTGKPEKVPELVKEMKNRNLTVDAYCYSVLMQSYASMNDLEGVERTLEEIEQDKEKCNWSVYSNLAALYLRTGDTEKAELALKKLEDFVKTPQHPCDSLPFHYLISLYAGIGNLDAVNRVWSSLKSLYPIINNTGYLVMLQSLSRLDDVNGLLKCFEEWNSRFKGYDKRIPSAVIGACLRHDRAEEAERFLEEAIEKSNSPFFAGREMLISHFLEKGETDSALRHMKAAVDRVSEEAQWNISPERVGYFMKCFKEQKDVDGAEEFFRLFKKVKCHDAKLYMLLLQIYLAAGKTDAGIRERMVEDGIEITTDLEQLLEEVCPK